MVSVWRNGGATSALHTWSWAICLRCHSSAHQARCRRKVHARAKKQLAEEPSYPNRARVLPLTTPRQPDARWHASALACRLELRHARFSGHRGRTCRERLAPTCRTVGARYGRSDCGWSPSGEA
eukprot:scaffold32214_cov61-Phaeocystis_antarctica.AAC.3